MKSKSIINLDYPKEKPQQSITMLCILQNVLIEENGQWINNSKPVYTPKSLTFFRSTRPLNPILDIIPFTIQLNCESISSFESITIATVEFDPFDTVTTAQVCQFARYSGQRWGSV
jgi:hypothetical protein